jgi:16S rRNA (guanine1516-N2)-methyltransferase
MSGILAGLYASAPERRPEAAQLAQALNLPLLAGAPDAPHLELDAHRFALRPGGGLGPVLVDFVGGRLGHRRRFGGGRGQTLARAIGLKGGACPRVLDATAGLGRDAFVLTVLGCTVEMLERDPVIAALLADGLRRARLDPELGPWIDQRLRLTVGDARDLLAGVDPAPEVVYLDPMYPERQKSALVKKEMRVFRQLVGDDPDAPELLGLALGVARQRVVVKRPRQAPALAGPSPSLSLHGKTTRYDVYLCRTGPAG